MGLFKRKSLLPNAAGDQLARTIADRIVRWQSALAARLNRAVNQYSRQRQKWLLAIFCTLSIGGLTLCLLLPFGQMAIKMQVHNFQTSHIGLPSDIQVKPRFKKTTDSLTLKK